MSNHSETESAADRYPQPVTLEEAQAQCAAAQEKHEARFTQIKGQRVQVCPLVIVADEEGYFPMPNPAYFDADPNPPTYSIIYP